MATTYEPIATATGNGSSSSITFSSIPQTYTDLIVSVVFQSTSGDYIDFQLNNDTSGSYSFTQLYGAGGSPGGAANTNQTAVIWESTPTSPEIANSTIHFLDYSNSTTYKPFLIRSNITTGNTVRSISGLWRNTSAISTLKIYTNGGGTPWTSATKITLYGIKAA